MLEFRFDLATREFGPESVIHFLLQEQEITVRYLGLLEGKGILPPHGQFETYDPNGKYFGFIRIALGFVDLRSYIIRGAHQILNLLVYPHPRAKVNELEVVVVADEKILGFDVPMQYPTMLGSLQTSCHTFDNMVSNGQGHERGVDKMPQVPVAVVLHHEEGLQIKIALPLEMEVGGRESVHSNRLHHQLIMEAAKNLNLFLEARSTCMPMFVNFQPVVLLVVLAQQNPTSTHHLHRLAALLYFGHHLVGAQETPLRALVLNQHSLSRNYYIKTHPISHILGYGPRISPPALLPPQHSGKQAQNAKQ